MLRIAIALLPLDARARYREEWHADIEHGRDIGVRPAEVTWGALMTAVRLAGAPAAHLDVSRSRSWIVRDVVAWGLGASAAGSALGMHFAAGFVEVGAVALNLVAAVVFAIVAVRRASRIGVVAAIVTAASLIGALGVSAALGWIGQLLLLLTSHGVVFISAVLSIGWACLPTESHASWQLRAPRHTTAVMLAAAVVCVVLVLAAFETLVLMPLTAAPELTLPEVYLALAAAGESGGEVMVWAWAAAWVVIIVAGLVAMLRRRWSRPSIVGATGIACALVVSTNWGAGFGLGMSLGDTFYAGVNSPFAPYLWTGAAIATAIGMVALLAPRPNHYRWQPAPALP